MKHLLKKTVLAASAAIMIGLCGTYAYFSDSLTVTNHIFTGDIQIGLKEYALSNKKEVAYKNPKEIMPGDVISKIPRITNYAEDCWIRVKLSYTSSKKGLEGFSDKDLSGIPTGWVKRGGYYYYTRILKKSDFVDVFHRISVPKEWTKAHQGQELGISIRADAVQADHFTPDFKAMSPWGDQDIQLCVHEQNNKITCRQQNVKLAVVFHGKAHKLLSVPDDFFSNFGKAMPGDVFQDQVTISNTTEKEAEMFFRTGVENQSAEQRKLLKEMQLAVRMNGKTLYQGNLAADKLAKEVSLGVFQPGQKGKLDFSVRIPSEWDNAYALKNADVKWIFTVHEDNEENRPSTSPNQEHTGSTPKNRSAAAGMKKTDMVKTGDETPAGEDLLLLAFSAIAGAVMFILRKGGKQQ